MKSFADMQAHRERALLHSLVKVKKIRKRSLPSTLDILLKDDEPQRPTQTISAQRASVERLTKHVPRRKITTTISPAVEKKSSAPFLPAIKGLTDVKGGLRWELSKMAYEGMSNTASPGKANAFSNTSRSKPHISKKKSSLFQIDTGP